MPSFAIFPFIGPRTGLSMTDRHEIWISRDDGTRLSIVDNVVSFRWNKVANGVGRCSIVLEEDFDRTLIAVDRKIEIWRAPIGGELRLENAYLIRRIGTQTNIRPLTRIVLHGVDGNDLLRRRIIAFAAGSSESKKTDNIDDMMKAIVRENLGSLAGNDPDGNSRSFDASFFSVDPDFGLGPSITKSFAYRKVLLVLEDLSEAARIAGDQVYFAVVPHNVSEYLFRTYINQIGQDRRSPGGNDPITFSLRDGNIEIPDLEEDFDDEENYVFGGGQGEAAARNIQTAFDLARINRSIWGRREAFRDARHESTDAGVTAEAEARLSEGRPKRRFFTSLLSVQGSRYGLDWDFGDRVTVVYAEQQFDGLVWSVKGSVDDEGLETIEGRLEVEDVA